MFVVIFPNAALTGVISTIGSSTNADLEGTPALLAFVLWLGFSIGYHAMLEWKYGKAIGKYLVTIRGANADGSPLSVGESVVRDALRLIDFLPVLYVVGIDSAVLSDRKERIGDRVADTAVSRD